MRWEQRGSLLHGRRGHHHVQAWGDLTFLDAGLVHGLFQHLPRILVFLGQLGKGCLLDGCLWLRDSLLLEAFNPFLWLWHYIIILLIIEETLLIDYLYIVLHAFVLWQYFWRFFQSFYGQIFLFLRVVVAAQI